MHDDPANRGRTYNISCVSQRAIAPGLWFFLLRITWLNWLALLLALFARPVVVLHLPWVHELVEIRVGAVGMCVREDCAPEPWLISHAFWSWDDLLYSYPLWLSLLVAGVVPALVHLRRRNALGSAFEHRPVVPGPEDPASYRSAPGYYFYANPRALRAHVQCFAVRLVAAMLCSGIAFSMLSDARFVKNYGCVGYSNLYSIPEYFAYLLLLLFVVLIHTPSPRQIFGRSAHLYEAWHRGDRAMQGSRSARRSSPGPMISA